MLRWFLPLVIAVGAASACNPPASSYPDAGGACLGIDYPCGPYGLTVGSIIDNLALTVQRNQDDSPTVINTPPQPITLSFYRNDPTFAALAIIIGAANCVPCQNEQVGLAQLDAMYNGRVAFLEAIVQDAQGLPANELVIAQWLTQFTVPFDMTNDATMALAPYYPANSFPSAMVIRLSDMKIIYQVLGPATGLQQALDLALGVGG